MPFKVLVVDDSSFYRRRVREILNQDPNLEVIGEANNGQVAIEQMQKLQPDVITMDVEMPVMDGIAAVRQIMKSSPTPILMFSSITQDGAEATISALEAGALDFLPKNFEDIAKDRQQATSMLRAKVKSIAGKRMPTSANTLKSPGRTAATQKFFKSSSLLSTPVSSRSMRRNYKLMAIGSSTGGPVALQKILTPLAADFPLPILLVQHMPGTFTSAFAQRLNGMCKIGVSEAQNGDLLRPGHAYLAPGGKQMLVEGSSSAARLKIIDSVAGEDHTYKPSVDLTFESLSKVFHGDVLGIILTGMGADGREGCKTLKSKGATIWAQDEASSVVYGMPQAVTVAGISERSLALDVIASEIITATKG
ncbi:chemotaxis response regulator protein-glutamate methylesterase [Alteromonas sp. ASW11-36]|uniref:Protein-glutamate methylesterase/protein-glutamine glutaminase n=1 Tax=Alteromonas arenosi TaxID=3055817 RepID=A0ABT7SVB3_9ALTE|nr:chemotaxis response regulator protein-glutamate methylesterase [Alteromonas sp. ASW11-36]MDM7860105.1 chemotaxis response regulator protein-glutamate methylesterase [Alteromonas sp. ASW11-36]